MVALIDLRQAAREIFFEALKSVDPAAALRRVVQLTDSQLQIVETTFNLETKKEVYAIALGKAARPMARSLQEILGRRLTAGVVSGLPEEFIGRDVTIEEKRDDDSFSNYWRVFFGGHPLPNSESLAAAEAAFELMRRAEERRALIIFLISGGGSAMMEWPRDNGTTLEELQALNRALVSCGASIREINAVRRAVSDIKGGALARRAPSCDQVSLIVSDTSKGREADVASGPTFEFDEVAPEALSIIERYQLEKNLPRSLLRAIKQNAPPPAQTSYALRRHYVLLDNEHALNAAAEAAGRRGLSVEIASDVSEQYVEEGCSQLLSRLLELRRQRNDNGSTVCLISGGEFACPVRGRGTGGRNSESALRWAIEMDSHFTKESNSFHVAALSAGTDGIDGNSPAAGAITDDRTLHRARLMNLDARQFLLESNAYAFFQLLGDTIITGATGTNVRDLRVMLAG